MNGLEPSYAVPSLLGLWFILMMVSAAKKKVIYIAVLLIAGLWPAGSVTINYATADRFSIETVSEIFHSISLVWWISIPIAAAVYWVSWSRENQRKFEEEASK